MFFFNTTYVILILIPLIH